MPVLLFPLEPPRRERICATGGPSGFLPINPFAPRWNRRRLQEQMVLQVEEAEKLKVTLPGRRRQCLKPLPRAPEPKLPEVGVARHGLLLGVASAQPGQPEPQTPVWGS